MYDLENMKKYFKDNCINQKLLELYKQKWKYIEEIKSKDKDGDIVFQLACIPANYYKCNYKVLIVGQETYKWHNRKSSAEDSMLYTLEKEYMKKTSSAFALFAYNFVSKINNFNSKCYKKSYFAWSNLTIFFRFLHSFVNPNIRAILEKNPNISFIQTDKLMVAYDTFF